jgi:4-hydroxybenzoate polyprenyltransferase
MGSIEIQNKTRFILRFAHFALPLWRQDEQKMHYIQLLRPLQWLKNTFVFAPIFFSSNLLKPDYFWPTFVVFASFCLISSAIYCFNDLRDVEADRQHPKKQHRPIASGAVSIKGGYTMMILCTISAFALLPLSKSPNMPFLYLITGAYWLMNIAYCLRLKQYALIDVTIIAIGFVMRVLIGGLTTDIWISQWLVLMTFLVTLFLAFTKRNDDYRIYKQTGQKPRVSITGYNKTFINEATAIVASVTMVCYIMYTMSEEVINRMGTNYVYLTSGWVLAGMLRYLQNMIVYGLSGSPTKSLVKDHFIQFCVLGWIASFFVIIYL